MALTTSAHRGSLDASIKAACVEYHGLGFPAVTIYLSTLGWRLQPPRVPACHLAAPWGVSGGEAFVALVRAIWKVQCQTGNCFDDPEHKLRRAHGHSSEEQDITSKIMPAMRTFYAHAAAIWASAFRSVRFALPPTLKSLPHPHPTPRGWEGV